jgi:predicted transcriptional regulator of viral defense system
VETFCLEPKMKERPEEIFRKHGGRLRMSEAIEHGITRYMLYSLRDRGVIEQVSRGIYRLVELPPISNPDLVTVSLRFPNAVICLVSALAFHDITTQIPHEVSVAMPRDSRMPSLDYPPIQAHRFSNAAYKSGIEAHRIDEVPVKVYSAEKTMADCFKFRNKMGMEVVLEALKLYKTRKKFDLGKLIKYAKICRVEKVMKPYLEATV